MKKYISPGAWFSLEYPDNWCEFEDTEDSFLFYNPNKWSGNFRISAYRGEGADYAAACMEDELREVRGAKKVRLGSWDCVYSAESFQENNVWYTTHIWVTGRGEISVECSFTVIKGESSKAGEAIVASLKVRTASDKPVKAVIPVRVLEINQINEDYDWAVSTVKKQLTKDFTGTEADLANLQKVMDSGRFNPKQRQAWEGFGTAFGVILRSGEVRPHRLAGAEQMLVRAVGVAVFTDVIHGSKDVLCLLLDFALFRVCKDLRHTVSPPYAARLT